MAAAPRQSWTDGGRLVRSHMPCASCGYDLHGLKRDGTCPECGTPVQRTFDAGGKRLASGLVGPCVLGGAAIVLLIGAIICHRIYASLHGTPQGPQATLWDISQRLGYCLLGLTIAAAVVWVRTRTLVYLLAALVCVASVVAWTIVCTVQL